MDSPIKKRILVVDDLESNRTSVAQSLRARHSVATAPHAFGALKLLNAEPFDVVLSDFDMPVHDGIWLLTQVERQFPTMRRFLMSTVPSTPITPWLRLGIVHVFFPKPVRLDLLLTEIER